MAHGKKKRSHKARQWSGGLKVTPALVARDPRELGRAGLTASTRKKKLEKEKMTLEEFNRCIPHTPRNTPSTAQAGPLELGGTFTRTRKATPTTTTPRKRRRKKGRGEQPSAGAQRGGG